jgi:uncharacterized phage protein (TIGR02216 family)
VIAYGLAVLKLPPDQFWTLTPRELAAVLAASAPPPTTPSRTGIEALMRAHPDDPPSDH